MKKELFYSVLQVGAVFLLVYSAVRWGLPQVSEQWERITALLVDDTSADNNADSNQDDQQRSCPSDQSEFYDNCTGTFVKQNGDRYIGEFKQDMMDGIGTYISADGATYRGNFKRDQRSGEGELTLADGTYYRGQFADDEFNGEGSIKLSSGDSYTGNFKDGEFDGNGVFTTADGTVTKGEFADGEFTEESNAVSSKAIGERSDAASQSIAESTNCASQQVTKVLELLYRYEAVKAAVFSQYSDSQNHTREAYWICPSDAVRPSPKYCEEFDRTIQRSQIGGYDLKNDWYVKGLYAATEVSFDGIRQISTDLNCNAERCVYFCEAAGVVRLNVKLAVNELVETKNFKIIGKNGKELDSVVTFNDVLNQMMRTYGGNGSIEPLKEDSHAWRFKTEYCAISKGSELTFEKVGSASSICSSR